MEWKELFLAPTRCTIDTCLLDYTCSLVSLYRDVVRCFETMLLCESIFILMDLVSMYVQSVVKLL